MSYRPLHSQIKEVLVAAGAENAEREAGWIVEAATGKSASESALATDDPSPAERARALELAHRRAGGEPLQYVTGVAGFRRLELEVGPGVFIPRPETELVAELAMDLVPPDGILVEVGTGSGAIALSVADERPDVDVMATETSEEALGWARRNRDRLGLTANLIHGDLFGGLPSQLRGRVDVVVSNPPYVPRDFALPPEIAAHEPEVALYADDAGLAVIKPLTAEARIWLRPGGWVVLEIGEVQRDAVGRILASAGYEDVAVHDDYLGRPRIAQGRNP